jgi:hypothetical protein
MDFMHYGITVWWRYLFAFDGVLSLRSTLNFFAFVNNKKLEVLMGLKVK